MLFFYPKDRITVHAAVRSFSFYHKEVIHEEREKDRFPIAGTTPAGSACRKKKPVLDYALYGAAAGLCILLLDTWRVSNYTPEYRETSSVGKRKLLTPDEVLRLPLDQALVILRGQKILKVEKYDYTMHPESKKLKPRKAVEHIPAWQSNSTEEDQDFISSLKSPPPPSRKKHRSGSVR